MHENKGLSAWTENWNKVINRKLKKRNIWFPDRSKSYTEAKQFFLTVTNEESNWKFTGPNDILELIHMSFIYVDQHKINQN